MSFESPDNEKDFPGLYNAPDQISVTEEDVDKGSKKREGKKEKKEGKDKKKDKGYVVFEEEDSEDEILPTDDLSIIKSPSKGKKIKPTFRFPKKDIFPKSKEKEEKKDREQRKSEDKKKEDKEGKKEKHKLKEKKKPKHRDVTAHSAHSAISAGVPDKPVFGVPLSVSVDRSKCHDGIELPAVFRECIDYIEEHGLACEGIYRISGVKSKVQQLKDCYNKGLPAYLCEHEPNVVASLLKQFLRELPEPVLTTAKMAKFEEASTLKTEAKRLEAMRKLIQDLPVCNRLLLSWMIVHMGHIIEHRTKNKMSLQNVSIVLSPTMQISHRVLNVFFSLAKKLFSDTQIKKYVPPLRPATSRWSLELPDNLIALEEELCKQESLLNTLHEELKTVEDQSKEEQLWEVQRVVTQLKRKIKFAHKASERKKELDSKKPKMVSELDELNLDLQPVSEAVEGGGSESGDHKVSTESLEAKRKSQELKRKSQEVENSKVAETAEIKDENKVEIKDENKVEIKDENKDDDKAENKVENKDENKDENKVVKDKVDSVEEKAAEGQEAAPSIQTENVVVTEEKAADSETPPVEPQPSDNTEQERETEKVEENETTKVVEDVEENSEEQEKTSSSIKPEEKASQDVEQVEDQQPMKPTGPIQPHLQLSNQPLEPIRICPQNSDSVDSDKMADTVEYKTAPTAPEGDQPPPDEEMTQLLEDEYALTLEEEELLAIGDELKQKIETEQSEIERLKQEIVELQYLRQDSDLEDYSSSSESEDDSDDEEELTELLNSLIAENEELEKKNSELCQKIHDERIACLDCKVSIRLIQQKQADSDNILDRDNPI